MFVRCSPAHVAPSHGRSDIQHSLSQGKISDLVTFFDEPVTSEPIKFNKLVGLYLDVTLALSKQFLVRRQTS